MGRGIALLLLAGCGRFGFDARLGSGGDAADAADAPSADSGGPAFTAIDVGGEFTCAIFAARAYCWGRNAASELGTGDTAPHALPTPVALPAGDVRQITAGNTHACAVLADGSAYCWGSAMLGDGVTTTSATPVRVGLSAVTEISAAYDFTCAIAGGDVYCWGDDSSERLGNGASLGSTPTPGLTLAGPATDVFTGGDHACAVLAAGTAWCWGHNDGPGALGLGTTTPTYAATPGQVVTLTAASAVTIAGYHACAIDGGGAYCWGTGTSGELGNGGTATSYEPVSVMLPAQ